MVAASGCAP